MGCLKVQAYGHPYADANPKKLRSLSKPVHTYIYIYTLISMHQQMRPLLESLHSRRKRSAV